MIAIPILPQVRTLKTGDRGVRLFHWLLVAATTFTGITGGEDGYETITCMLLAMIALHVVAVVAMSLLTRDSLIGAMITGGKKTTHFPNAHPAPS